jgi:hypothetical protein
VAVNPTDADRTRARKWLDNLATITSSEASDSVEWLASEFAAVREEAAEQLVETYPLVWSEPSGAEEPTPTGEPDHLVQRVELWYPRVHDPKREPDQPTEVHVSLIDVRAADRIIIDYDFVRDGYRIRMATVHEWEPDDPNIGDPKLVEVAFVPAWRVPPNAPELQTALALHATLGSNIVVEPNFGVTPGMMAGVEAAMRLGKEREYRKIEPVPSFEKVSERLPPVPNARRDAYRLLAEGFRLLSGALEVSDHHSRQSADKHHAGCMKIAAGYEMLAKAEES